MHPTLPKLITQDKNNHNSNAPNYQIQNCTSQHWQTRISFSHIKFENECPRTPRLNTLEIQELHISHIKTTITPWTITLPRTNASTLQNDHQTKNPNNERPKDSKLMEITLSPPLQASKMNVPIQKQPSANWYTSTDYPQINDSKQA